MNTPKCPVSFTSACAINEHMIYVASFPDGLTEDVDFTRLFVLNTNLPEKWFYHDIFDQTINSVAVRIIHDKRECYAMSKNGFVEIYSSAATKNEKIFVNISGRTGNLTRIRQIGDSIYACGAGNQIYCRKNNIWTRFDHSIREVTAAEMDNIIDAVKNGAQSNDIDFLELTKKMRKISMLEDIAGVNENDIYSCGSNGVLWHWNGLQWSRLDSGTRQHLNAIHCVSEDVVFIAGDNGTLLKGNKKTGFRRMHTGKLNANFWTIRSLNGIIYIGTSIGIVRATEQTINFFIPEVGGIESLFSVVSIDVAQNVLWVVCDKFILKNKAENWELILHPDNI